MIPTLQAEGYEVLAAQHYCNLDTLKGDVATVTRTLERVSSPAILVGHSYGGTVITAAGTDGRVAGLVYIAALAPDAGETSQGQQQQFPTTEIFSHIEVADGRVWMLPEGVGCFAGDLSKQEQKIVWATHAAPAADLFTQKLDGTAWRSKRSWYIVAKNDRTVQPELQRFVAKRMGATTYEVESSHVPMLSNPGLVIDVIRTAANAIQGSKGAYCKGRPGPWRRAHEAPCRSHHRCPDRHRASGTVGSIFLRPICASNAAVVARARVNYAGRSLGLAEALVQDGHGRVLGHATTRCFLFDSGVRDGGATDVAPPGRDVDEPTCDPYLRPVRGGPVPDVVWAERSRLEVIEGFRNRELPVPPVSHFFGLRVLSAEAGRILIPDLDRAR